MRLYTKAGAWAKEFVQVFRGPLYMAIYKEPPKHYLSYTIDGKVPVILIPGIGNTWSYLRGLGNKISLLGHPVHIVPGLGKNLDSIPESAKILHEVVEGVAPIEHNAKLVRKYIEEKDIKGIVLVAHSKGGLIGKYLLTHFNQDNRVLGLVAIATPFSGSAMAKLMPHPAFKELRLDSKIIADLTAHTDNNKKIISIYPEYDTHVRAPKGSYLEGAFENIEIPIGGHSVVDNKKVQREVISAIEKITCWKSKDRSVASTMAYPSRSK